MDLLEYKQIEEAVKYIENYNSSDKLSDFTFSKKLNRFIRKDIVVGRRTIGEGNDRMEIPYCYETGCREDEIEAFRKILLSANYNYKEIKDKLLSETDKQQIENDVKNETYKGKTLEDYEALRLEAVNKVKKSKSFIEKLEIIANYSREINKGLLKTAEYKLIKKAASDEKVRDAAKRMIRDNVPLTQIAEYLQTDILKLNDIYFEVLREKRCG